MKSTCSSSSVFVNRCSGFTSAYIPWFSLAGLRSSCRTAIILPERFVMGCSMLSIRKATVFNVHSLTSTSTLLAGASQYKPSHHWTTSTNKLMSPSTRRCTDRNLQGEERTDAAVFELDLRKQNQAQVRTQYWARSFFIGIATIAANSCCHSMQR